MSRFPDKITALTPKGLELLAEVRAERVRICKTARSPLELRAAKSRLQVSTETDRRQWLAAVNKTP